MIEERSCHERFEETHSDHSPSRSSSKKYGELKLGLHELERCEGYWLEAGGRLLVLLQLLGVHADRVAESRGKWYYLQPSGAAATGWQKIGSYWYAFDSSCAMRTGWFKDGSTWYYLRPAKDVPGAGPEGSMLAGGTWTIGGKAYRFNSSGACLNP